MAFTALVGLIVITTVVEVVPAPVKTISPATVTPAVVVGLLPDVGTVKLILSVVDVPILMTPELPIKETSIFLPPQPTPSASVATLFNPVKVIVETLKKLLAVSQSSEIAVVTPSVSQATACLAP